MMSYSWRTANLFSRRAGAGWEEECLLQDFPGFHLFPTTKMTRRHYMLGYAG